MVMMFVWFGVRDTSMDVHVLAVAFNYDPVVSSVVVADVNVVIGARNLDIIWDIARGRGSITPEPEFSELHDGVRWCPSLPKLVNHAIDF